MLPAVLHLQPAVRPAPVLLAVTIHRQSGRTGDRFKQWQILQGRPRGSTAALATVHGADREHRWSAIDPGAAA